MWRTVVVQRVLCRAMPGAPRGHREPSRRLASVKRFLAPWECPSQASRPQLDLLLKLLRTGDVLSITRLDRLSRSVQHLINLGVDLRERGVGLKVLEQGIDTATVEGRAMFGMLSVLGELQRELIVANTRDGLATARARGRTGGRRPRLSLHQAQLAQQLYDARSHTVQQIADMFGVPRSTVYGYLTRDEKTAQTG